MSLESLRKRIAVVPQDTSLFDETIEYNLRYGNSSSSDEEIASVIEKCNLNETIAKLKDGLQTVVGERGARLSGGERQKVSIARALLKNPTVILCDEVTSAVDAFAERDIVETLKKATEQRTTLTIAHRLSSIVHCDPIIVLDKGQIVEQGTHEELLQRGSVYAKMWAAQNGQSSAKRNKKSSAFSGPGMPTIPRPLSVSALNRTRDPGDDRLGVIGDCLDGVVTCELEYEDMDYDEPDTHEI